MICLQTFETFIYALNLAVTGKCVQMAGENRRHEILMDDTVTPVETECCLACG